MGLFKGKKIQFSDNSDYQIFRLLFKQQQNKNPQKAFSMKGKKWNKTFLFCQDF